MKSVYKIKKKELIVSMAEMSSSDIERYVRGVNFPADKNELVDYARRQNAPDNVIRALDNLPNQRFNSPMDITSRMKEESRGSRMGSSGSSSRESRY